MSSKTSCLLGIRGKFVLDDQRCLTNSHVSLLGTNSRQQLCRLGWGKGVHVDGVDWVTTTNRSWGIWGVVICKGWSFTVLEVGQD